MPKQSYDNPFKSLLHFSKDQQKGVIGLFSIIIILQIIYYFVDFSETHQPSREEQAWLSLQEKVDTNEVKEKKYEYKIYPYNPNFITDFKGAKLGMSIKEIDRLLAFRKLGKFANSPEEFQKVTGISDSLLRVMSPNFKFPDWVVNKQNSTGATNSSKTYEKYTKKEVLKVLDINQATKEDLMKISGIGEALSDRILKQKEVFGGYVSMEQMNDVWGLSPEVLASLNQYFKITTLPKINKININNASIKELGSFYYYKLQCSLKLDI